MPPLVDLGDMNLWTLSKGDLKKYPHFDAPIGSKEAVAYVSDPAVVASHSFYPFLRYVKRWNRYAKKGKAGKPKERPIRYAARLDAYIFSYYRYQLSELYEAELARLKLGNNILAYRRIVDPIGGGGKTNIHFARDAISEIRSVGDCYAICLDVSNYFESLDHQRLKSIWCRLLDVNKLPDDHFAVFKAITSYSYVEKMDAYRRLGYFGKKILKSGKSVDGFLVSKKDIPRQLCSPSDFRKKISGVGGKSIIKKNQKPYGVPQGAPLSDLLANFYLIDFDLEMKKIMAKRGGTYFRYSDDILLVGRGTEKQARNLLKKVQALIRKFGSQLEVKDKKTTGHLFAKIGSSQSCVRFAGESGGNGLEYLGFRYDGNGVFIRNSTLSNLNRKLLFAARSHANRVAASFQGKTADEAWEIFRFENFFQRFGRVEYFEESSGDVKNWTFWTYARRASLLLGSDGQKILRQLRDFKRSAQVKARREVENAVAMQKPT